MHTPTKGCDGDFSSKFVSPTQSFRLGVLFYVFIDYVKKIFNQTNKCQPVAKGKETSCRKECLLYFVS